MMVLFKCSGSMRQYCGRLLDWQLTNPVLLKVFKVH